MEPNPDFYAGAEISSGLRPVTIAVLDSDLKIVAIQQCSVPNAIILLEEYSTVQLAINVPSSRHGQIIYSDLKKKLKSAGFTPTLTKEGERKWIETNALECYRTIRAKLFPRRTLEGRIQRALILFEEGVQIHDPMDFFEEITRHKLLQGFLPDDIIYSIKQLDALIAAYVSWLVVNRPHKVITRGDLILPKATEDS